MTQTVKDSGSGGRFYRAISPSFSNSLYAAYDPSKDDYVQNFRRLLRKWRLETAVVSSSTDILSRREFSQIVQLGEKAIPLIIEEISIHPDHLIAALPMITEEDPVPEFARGNLSEMANSWIAWYDRHK